MSESPSDKRTPEAIKPLTDDLQRLARAIALGEGFALYILLSPTQKAAQPALRSLEAEVMRLRHDTTSSFTLFLAPRPLTSPSSALEALFDESSVSFPTSFLVLDASSTTEDDEQILGFWFARLNERRNQLIARRKLPLLLVLPLFAERLLVQAAPDLWSIRSLPAVVLAEQRSSASAIRSAPEPDHRPAGDRTSPLRVALVYADKDLDVAFDIERHLQLWSVDGMIRFERCSPGRQHPWVTIQAVLLNADLVLELLSPELLDWFEEAPWLNEVLAQGQQVVSFTLRADERSRRLSKHRQLLLNEYRPLSLRRQNERDDVMLELTQVVRKLVERGRPLGPSRDVELLRAPQMPGTVRESEPTLTRAEVRKLLDQTLRTSADFDAFCIDHFENVFRRYSGGMSRIERTNLLLQLESPERIWGALRSYRDRHT